MNRFTQAFSSEWVIANSCKTWNLQSSIHARLVVHILDSETGSLQVCFNTPCILANNPRTRSLRPPPNAVCNRIQVCTCKSMARFDFLFVFFTFGIIIIISLCLFPVCISQFEAAQRHQSFPPLSPPTQTTGTIRYKLKE